MLRKVLLLTSVFVLSALGLSLPTARTLAAVSCDAGTYSAQSNVNARVSPSPNGRILASIPAGTQISVSGPQLGDVVSGSGVWCVTTANGQTAYVHSGALALVSAGQPAAGQPSADAGAPSAAGQTYKVINANSINGRGAPNANAKVLAVIPSGAEVTVTGQVTGTRVSGSDQWYTVSYEGKTVYVHSSNLAPVAPPPPAADQPAAPEGPTGPMVAPKGSGTYTVNVDIAPGKWESTGRGRFCYWERLDGNGDIIDNSLGEAGGTITIQPSDAKVRFQDCGAFQYVEVTPLPSNIAPTAPHGSGYFTVGTEIAVGEWRSEPGHHDCYWERLDANQNILDNHFGLSGGHVAIRPGDYEVRFSDCGTFTDVDGQAPVLQGDAYAPKGDGFYRVGQEIAPGNWTTTGPGDSCYWASLGAYQEIHQNNFGVTGEKIYIPPTDFEFQVQGCGQLVYTG